MTKRFSTKALRISCCAGVLIASSALAGGLSNMSSGNSQVQLVGPHGGTIVSALNGNFAAVSNHELASMTVGSRDISGTSSGGLAAAPKISLLSPLIGLLAAVFSTQFLRRRRAAELSASHISV